VRRTVLVAVAVTERVSYVEEPYMSDKLRVYITVDTETSMGGAWRNPEYAPLPLERPVFGKYGSRFYGISLIMDILESYDLRATFFTEVFCAYIVGHVEVEKVFKEIRTRGHDPQLTCTRPIAFIATS